MHQEAPSANTKSASTLIVDFQPPNRKKWMCVV